MEGWHSSIFIPSVGGFPKPWDGRLTDGDDPVIWRLVTEFLCGDQQSFRLAADVTCLFSGSSLKPKMSSSAHQYMDSVVCNCVVQTPASVSWPASATVLHLLDNDFNAKKVFLFYMCLCWDRLDLYTLSTAQSPQHEREREFFNDFRPSAPVSWGEQDKLTCTSLHVFYN